MTINLNVFGASNTQTVSTPLETNVHLLAIDGTLPSDITLYH